MNGHVEFVSSVSSVVVIISSGDFAIQSYCQGCIQEEEKDKKERMKTHCYHSGKTGNTSFKY